MTGGGRAPGCPGLRRGPARSPSVRQFMDFGCRQRDGIVRGYVASMAVFSLWSAPRARSTAFFRSMAERSDMTVLHEPFCNLRDYGETEAGAQTFDSPASLLAW